MPGVTHFRTKKFKSTRKQKAYQKILIFSGKKADQGSKDVRTFSGYMIVGHR